MESTDSCSAPSYPQLPPGFRFHPTDEELIVHYLKRKVAASPLPVSIIADIDLYKFDPWELPAKAIFGEQEWYFFSPRDRKYPNGARPNRAATSGYWKATGTDKPVLTAANGNQKVGVKKALVFYRGKPPRGVKSDWIMHEYRLLDGNNSSITSNKMPRLDLDASKKSTTRLDDWVLCRIYKKNSLQRSSDQERDEDFMAGHHHHQQQQNHNNQKLMSRPFASINGTDAYFDGMAITGVDVDHHQSVLMHHASLPHQMYTVPPRALLPNTMKRLISSSGALSSPYWDEIGSVASSSSSKGFHSAGDGTSTGTDVGNSSFASLLNQLPPAGTAVPAILGQIGHDRHGGGGGGVLQPVPFQLSSAAWNS